MAHQAADAALLPEAEYRRLFSAREFDEIGRRRDRVRQVGTCRFDSDVLQRWLAGTALEPQVTAALDQLSAAERSRLLDEEAEDMQRRNTVTAVTSLSSRRRRVDPLGDEDDS